MLRNLIHYGDYNAQVLDGGGCLVSKRRSSDHDLIEGDTFRILSTQPRPSYFWRFQLLKQDHVRRPTMTSR